jgi:predicted RNA binding protein YcfA (HicA-like mRNA interferase family)
MPKIPPLSGRKMLAVLLKADFYVHHQSGSHARLFHRKRAELRITIPVHNKDLPEKTMMSILKQADISEEDFLKLLK